LPVGDEYVDLRDGSRWTVLIEAALFRGLAVVCLSRNGARKWVPASVFAEYFHAR
jgi:hypothetical protein